MTGQTFLIFVVVAAILFAGALWALRADEPTGEATDDAPPTLVGALLDQFSARASTASGGSSRDHLLELFVIASAILSALGSLHVYWSPEHQLLAAPDYAAETIPALNGLHAHGIKGYLDNLPGYPGIMMVQLIPAEIARILGLDEPTTWRFLSCIGIAAIALSVLAALPLFRASTASRGAVRTAIVLAVCSPAAYWALRIGHPEEVLTCGLLLGAVIAAARERPIIAGILLGFAVGKAWPAAAALPVIGLFLPNVRRTITACVTSAIAIAVIYLPPLLLAGNSVKVLSTLGQQGIFNVGQVFWWFGTPLQASVVRDPAQQSVPQPRGLGPEWSGSISHPLVLGVGVAIGLIWVWSLFNWHAGSRHATALRAALRTDGRTRSIEDSAQLAGGAFLVMAGILYARCFLDTWNVPYYLLPGLVFGALGETLIGRRPVMSLVATALMWKWAQPGDATVRTAPDIYTALYLGWTIPFCLAYLKLGFGAIRRPAESAAPADEQAPQPSAGEPLPAAG